MKPEYAAKKAELAQYLPKTDHADIGGRAGKGAEDFGDGKKAERKRERQKKKNGE